MAVSISRLKLKQSPTDVWSTRERLCLASSVMRSGDQNWVSVSRAIRAFGESNRPPDWFSQKNCALQYSDLLEKVETPKRKRGERGEIETPGECIIRKLTIERIEELKKITQEERESYKKLQNELERISSGEMDDKLQELWEEILEKQKEEERKAAEHNKWLQEREAAKQAALALNKTKSLKPVKTPQPATNIRRSSSQSEQGSEPESFIDSPLNETQAQTEDDSNASEIVPADPITSTPKPNVSSVPTIPPSTSPLLTSLLKSPTTTTPIPAFSILHSAITQSKEVSPSPIATSPSTSTISTLLNSSPSKSGLIPHSSSDAENETVAKSTLVSPSAGAPTLSRLLEMPLASPGKPLPPLPVVSTESVSSEIPDSSLVEPEVAEDVIIETTSSEPSQITETTVKDEQSVEEIETDVIELETTASSPVPESNPEGEIQDKEVSEEILDKEIVECVENLISSVETQVSSVIETSPEEVPTEDIKMEESPTKESDDSNEIVIENKEVVEVSDERETSSPPATEQETNTTETKEEVIEMPEEEIVIQETVEEAVTIEVPYEEETLESEKVNSPVAAATEELVVEEPPTENKTPTSIKEVEQITSSAATTTTIMTTTTSTIVTTPTTTAPTGRVKRGRGGRRSSNQIPAVSKRGQGTMQKNEETENEESKTEVADKSLTDDKNVADKEKEEIDKEVKGKEAESKKSDEKAKSKMSVREKSKEREEEKEKEKGKTHHRKKEIKDEKKDKKVDEKKDVKEDKKEEKKKTEEKEQQRAKKEEPKEKRAESKKRKFSKDEGTKEKKKEECTAEKSKPRLEESQGKDSKSKAKSEEPQSRDSKAKTKTTTEESQSKDSKTKAKSEEPQPKEVGKSTRKGKEKDKDPNTLVFVDTDDDKMSEKEDYSVSSRHFPTDSIPNSPASNTLSDDQESLREYKVWKKAIMLVWRSAANHKFANVFLHPVTEEVAPGYHSVVIRPMDLSQIKKNIENGLIKTTGEFQRDMMLMFQNAIMYNSSDHDVFHMAVEMQKEVMRHIQDFLATQLMVQTAEISKSLRRETRELTHKRSSESQNEKSTEEGKRGTQEPEGNKAKKRRIARTTDD